MIQTYKGDESESVCVFRMGMCMCILRMDAGTGVNMLNSVCGRISDFELIHAWLLIIDLKTKGEP